MPSKSGVNKSSTTNKRTLRKPPAIEWTAEKDNILLEAIRNPIYMKKNKKTGELRICWTQICKDLFPEAPKVQVIHQRYCRVLDPNLKKDSWTKREDEQIFKLVKIYGNAWADIARHMPGRCDTKIKARYGQLIKGKNSTSPTLSHSFNGKKKKRVNVYESEEEFEEEEEFDEEESNEEEEEEEEHVSDEEEENDPPATDDENEQSSQICSISRRSTEVEKSKPTAVAKKEPILSNSVGRNLQGQRELLDLMLEGESHFDPSYNPLGSEPLVAANVNVTCSQAATATQEEEEVVGAPIQFVSNTVTNTVKPLARPVKHIIYKSNWYDSVVAPVETFMFPKLVVPDFNQDMLLQQLAQQIQNATPTDFMDPIVSQSAQVEEPEHFCFNYDPLNDFE